MNELTQAVGFGIIMGCIISLSAVALSLQWSVTNIPNFAHGELLTAGAFGALFAQALTTNLVVDAIAAVALGGLTAVAMYWGAIEPFLRRRAHIGTMFVVTISLSIIVQNVFGAISEGGTEVYQLPVQKLAQVGPFEWTSLEVAIIIVSVVVIFSLVGFQT